MAGRFEGLSDLEWRLLEDVFPPPLRSVAVGCRMRRSGKGGGAGIARGGKAKAF
jgi:hypothetical protein